MANVRSYSRKSKTGKIHRVDSHYRKNPTLTDRERASIVKKVSGSGLKGMKALEYAELEAKHKLRSKETKPEMKKPKESKKEYNVRFGVGHAKYVVNFHDGKRKHDDGSKFFDIMIFKNKVDLAQFEKKLLDEGYEAK